MSAAENKNSDIELISRCLAPGNAEAWECFVRKYSNLIWSSIHKAFRSSSYTYSPEDVEDVFNSIFLSLLENDGKKLRQYQARNSCALSTWLAVVAAHKAIDHCRERRRHQRRVVAEEDTLDLAIDTTPNREATLMLEQDALEFERRIAGLTAQEQAMLELLRAKNIKAEEAAQELGISVAAFYTRKHRLIEKIKKS